MESPSSSRDLQKYRRGSAGRILLPPRMEGDNSDPEDWLREPSFYQDRLSKLEDAQDKDTLMNVLEHFKSPGPCPFECPAKQNFSRERLARHLIEHHSSRYQVWGCREGASCEEQGKPFRTRRAGELVRHLVSQHSVGTERAMTFLYNMEKYPNRDQRPPDAFYPRHLCLLEETNGERSRLQERGRDTNRPPPSAAAGAPPAEVETLEAAVKEATELLVGLTQEVPEDSPTTPSPLPSATARVSLPEADPITEEATRTFLIGWDRATSTALEAFQEAVKLANSRTKGELEAARERIDALEREREGKEAEITRLQERCAQAEEKAAKAEEEMEKSKEKSRKAKKDAVYETVRFQALEQEMTKWDRDFVGVTGMSLRQWDGEKESLVVALTAQESD